ncbi:hypothetical protein RB213_010045 [Colletotrichum asianum]
MPWSRKPAGFATLSKESLYKSKESKVFTVDGPCLVDLKTPGVKYLKDGREGTINHGRVKSIFPTQLFSKYTEIYILRNTRI